MVSIIGDKMVLTKNEIDFFEKVQHKTVKISLNMGKDTLAWVDELSEIFSLTRTLVIESIIRTSLHSYVETIQKANKEIQKTSKTKKELAILYQKLAVFKQKLDT